MFKPPSNEYDDFYESAKFHLTWNLNVMLSIALGVISIAYAFVEPRYVIHYSIGTCLALSGVIYMRARRKYKAAAIVLSFLTYILVCSSIFLVEGAPHIIEFFWLINIVLYVYFSMGERWGRVFLFLEVLIAGVYFLTGFADNIRVMPSYTADKTWAMSIEFAISCFMLGYIIHQFKQTKEHAELKYRRANDELSDEKRIVEQQNAENTVLIQEIHHRVKNNLQVITSLLRIQSGQLNSEEARRSFQDAINRIMTMALIHQKMYQGEKLAEIDLEDYLQSLVNDLIESNHQDVKIDLNINVQVEQVDQRSLVPLALIINELVTNSLKHGFDSGNTGVIQISILKGEDGLTKMKYSDDGVWKEPNGELTLGMQLIDAFTEQLDGEYEFERKDNNSRYTFNIKLN